MKVRKAEFVEAVNIPKKLPMPGEDYKIDFIDSTSVKEDRDLVEEIQYYESGAVEVKITMPEDGFRVHVPAHNVKAVRME